MAAKKTAPKKTAAPAPKVAQVRGTPATPSEVAARLAEARRTGNPDLLLRVRAELGILA